jgi:hypothetical protein
LHLGDGLGVRRKVFWIAGIKEAALAGFSVFQKGFGLGKLVEHLARVGDPTLILNLNA